jgi:hypothetical protein
MGLNRNEEATPAFRLFKKVMTKPLVLTLPDLNKLFMVEFDASSVV